VNSSAPAAVSSDEARRASSMFRRDAEHGVQMAAPMLPGAAKESSTRNSRWVNGHCLEG
jgi:hypothetical protein